MEIKEPLTEAEQIKPLISSAEQLMLIDDTEKWKETLERDKPDMLYFLDKSARPLYWFIRAVYQKDTDFPQVRFLNIGEEKEGLFDSVIEHSDFPELQAGKKFTPKKVMIVDEKSQSGESLQRAAQVVQKLYGLKPEQISQYSVLTAFPSWIRKSAIIGVEDRPDTQLNPLSQPVIDIEISPIEAELVNTLKKQGVKADDIDKHFQKIRLDEPEKQALRNRLELVLDDKRKVTVRINATLKDWEVNRIKGDLQLREELKTLAVKQREYGKHYDRFKKIEEQTKSAAFGSIPFKGLFESLLMTWNPNEHLYTCDAQLLTNLADQIDRGDIDLSVGMQAYYLITYNRLHPSDWNIARGNYLDLECSSLNYLAEKVIQKL